MQKLNWTDGHTDKLVEKVYNCTFSSRHGNYHLFLISYQKEDIDSKIK